MAVGTQFLHFLWIILLGLSGLSFAVQQRKPPPTPPRCSADAVYVAEEGQTARISCLVDKEDVGMYAGTVWWRRISSDLFGFSFRGWYQKDRIAVFREDAGGTTYNFTMIIRNATVLDAGTYSCQLMFNKPYPKCDVEISVNPDWNITTILGRENSTSRGGTVDMFLKALVDDDGEAADALFQEGSLYRYMADSILGHSPLHLAVLSGSARVAEALLRHGANPDETDRLGRRMLHLATMMENKEMAKVLLRGGADPFAANEGPQDDTPLLAAVRLGNIEIARLFLETEGAEEHVDDIPRWTHRPLRTAVLQEVGLDMVRLLVEVGRADPELAPGKRNVLHDMCTSPFRWRIIGSPDLDVARYLLANTSIDANARDGRGTTPLIGAVQGRGNLGLVRLLVEVGGADVNAREETRWTESDGSTALHHASRLGHADIVRYLVSLNGTEVERKAWLCSTPLHVAIEKGHADVVRILVTEGRAEPNDELLTAPTAEMARILLDEGKADPNHRDGSNLTALHNAVSKDRPEVARVLLARGADPNARAPPFSGATPLMLAATGGRDGVVKALLESDRTEVEARQDDNETALYKAASSGRVETVRLLVAEGGADAASKNLYLTESTPLHISSSNGHLGVVRYLLSLEDRVEADGKNALGKTALYYAALAGRVDVARALLESGRVDVNGENGAHRRSALQQASYWGRYGYDDTIPLYGEGGERDLDLYFAEYSNGTVTVRVLLESGADVHQRDANNFTALYLADYVNGTKTVRLLLNAGADPNVRCGRQLWSPLFVASFRGSVDAVRVLLDFPGTEIDLPSLGGYTPLEAARLEGYKDIVKLLLERGATDTERNLGDSPRPPLETNLDKEINREQADLDYLEIHCTPQ